MSYLSLDCFFEIKLVRELKKKGKITEIIFDELTFSVMVAQNTIRG
jgi:hypothetical protein